MDIINKTLDQNESPVRRVVDPSASIQISLDMFKDWYNLLRQPLMTTDDLDALAAKTYKLQWTFKKVFPSKSGTFVLCTMCTTLCTLYTQMCTVYTMCSDYIFSNHCFVVHTGEGLAWKFVKFHMIRHIINHIILFGWIENSSCQAGEHNHKFYLKLLRRLTNNHEDWPKQIFNIHAKEQALQNIIGEIGECFAVPFVL